MKKLDELLIGAKCRLRQLIFGKQPGIDGRLLSEDIVMNICFKEEKKNLCTGPECILIDDLPPNIEAWRSCGGTGILHESSEKTMAVLREMGIIE